MLGSRRSYSPIEGPARTEKEGARSMSEDSNLTASQKAMVDLWEEHLSYEFEAHSTEKTLSTMTEDPVNINVPVLTGGVGVEEVRKYYAEYFIPRNPPDTEVTLLSRTVGEDRLVDELIQKFTHTIEMDYMLPGIPPTGRRVEVPVAVVVEFREGEIASEHIYWDQASVLVQVGLLDANTLPVVGLESARKMLDPTSVPSELLIERAKRGKLG
jgi:carboxymethylenebutenolidase